MTLPHDSLLAYRETVEPPRRRSALGVKEIGRGINDTLLLIAMRWRGARHPLARWGMGVGGVILLLGIIMSINVGYAIRIMASQGEDSAAGIFAMSWILSLQRNEIGDIGAIVLGGALAAAVFAPFTGSSTLGLAPVEDLYGLRLSRLHRFFDSLIINCVSGIGLLQLLALTGITSVLSIEANRGPALVVAWVIWIFVITLTTAIGWSLEWGLRRFGPSTRWKVGGTVVAGLTIAVILDPNHGRTVFGVGRMYSSFMDSANSGTFVGFLLPFLAALLIVFVTAILGMTATRQALALPATVSQRVKVRKARKTPKNQTVLATLLLWNILWRTPEVRRPIIAVLAIGIPGMLLAELDANLETAILLAVPLAVALSAGVNIFAVIGPGMSWLAAQPRILTRMFKVAAVTQAVVTLVIMMLLWGVSFIAGKTTTDAGLRIFIGGIVAGCLASLVSMELSIRRPMRARLSGRGDSLIPPLTALSYLIYLIVFACIPATVFSGAYSEIQIAAVVMSILVFLVWNKWQEERFINPANRSRIVAEVAST